MSKHMDDLLAIYALGGLTEAEQAELETYLDETPTAVAELNAYAETADMLMYAIPPLTPNPEIKTALLARIEAESASKVVPVVPRTTTQPTFWQSLKELFQTPAMTTASFVVAGLAIIWAVSLSQQLNDIQQNLTISTTNNQILSEKVEMLQTDNGRLTTELQTLSEQLATNEERMALLTDQNELLDVEKVVLETAVADLMTERESLSQVVETLTNDNNSLLSQNELLTTAQAEANEILALFGTPDVQTVKLPGTETQPQAEGQMVISQEGDLAILLVSGMEPLPDGSVYQVLLIEGEFHQTADIFTVDTQGDGVLLVRSQTPLFDFDSIAVSIEPVGGSVQRTGDVILLGDV